MALWVSSRRSGQGHEPAFRLLWKRHAQSVRRAIERTLGTYRALADEVFQEAWSEVSGATAYAPGVFRSFIRTIALRKAFDRLAALKRSPAVLTVMLRERGDPEELEGDEWPADVADPARAAQARQGAMLVLEVVSTLPEPQRRAWALRFVEQCTYEEIGEAMCTPLGTAKTRVRIASAAVRRGLRARGVGWEELADGYP